MFPPAAAYLPAERTRCFQGLLGSRRGDGLAREPRIAYVISTMPGDGTEGQ